jgi:hypothetical protein
LWWFLIRRRNASEPHPLEPHLLEPQSIFELGEPKPWEMEARDKPAEMEVPQAISKQPVQYHEVQA